MTIAVPTRRRVLHPYHALKSMAEIPGLYGWWDASQIAGNDGDAVTQWDDLSGNARHLTQATAANKPTLKIVNGLREVRFDGGDYMSTAAFAQVLAQPTSVIIVCRMTPDGFGRSQFDGLAAPNRQILSVSAANNLVMNAGTPRTIRSAATFNADFHVIGLVFNGASSIANYDGGHVTPAGGSPGAQGLDGLRVGANITPGAFSNGALREIALFSVALNPIWLVRATEILARKWQVPRAA